MVTQRSTLLETIRRQRTWDILVIGGGATGLGIAVDAATRGYSTLLLERSDLAKGTSSRSTKLVHGGVRYLQQGNITLVLEALRERGILLRNAPHLVHNQQFLIPNYSWWDHSFYGIGLKIYDWMAGKLGLGSSRFIDLEETMKLAPTIEKTNLRGSIIYHDGQFDDARLAINLAQTAASAGATLLNYVQVTGFIKEYEKIVGVSARDEESGELFSLRSRVVINATGVFADHLMNMDKPGEEPVIRASQGIHLVVDAEFLPGNCALMIPRTDDKRVLFAVPWHGKIILGTTDTPVEDISDEPEALDEEIDFILKHIGRYLVRDPRREDVRSVFAGLRPLVNQNKKNTAALSREHLLLVSESGLMTITGGKWTTYRRMAKDVVDEVIQREILPAKECITRDLRIYGHDKPVPLFSLDDVSDHDVKQAVFNAVNEEWCRTTEDFLSRRTRQLFLDANKAIDWAPKVSTYLGEALEENEDWVQKQTHSFITLAKHYLPGTKN